jgi:hypothetical protein
MTPAARHCGADCRCGADCHLPDRPLGATGCLPASASVGLGTGTGGVSEQILAIFRGVGANGKSTLLDVVLNLSSPPACFTAEMNSAGSCII